MAARPAIHPTRHQNAQVFQGRRISGLHPRYTTRTDRGNEGLFDESVGVTMIRTLYWHDKSLPPYTLVYVMLNLFQHFLEFIDHETLKYPESSSGQGDKVRQTFVH